MIEIKNSCPNCDKTLSDEILKFTQKELEQGGKNVKCPACEIVLWIPPDGIVESVPIILASQSPSKNQGLLTLIIPSRPSLTVEQLKGI